MSDSNVTDSTASAPPSMDLPALVDQGQTRVGQLLAVLCDSAPAAPNRERRHAERRKSEIRFESELAVVRLGIATSLFYAMRTKHAPTAAHCLRVALSCSAWAERMGLDDATRDRIEVAALLHDLGKIGIPDRILRKPGKLSVDEQLTMDCCPEIACEILRGCTSDNDLLEIISHSNTWYNSRRQDEGPRGDAVPIGARMLAVANAFDAMTTDSVYRRSMSRERAIEQLNQGSGSQFDPELVADFSRMLEKQPEMLQGAIIDRWLSKLEGSRTDGLWEATGESIKSGSEIVRREGLFFQELIDHMDDGVVFTDTEGTITQWNGVMHQLTSIASEAIVGKSWSDECIRLRERDSSRPDGSCLVAECLRSGARVARPMLIEQPGDDPTPVHIQVSPVVGGTPGTHGTVVIVRDLSDQANLEEQLESLYYQTTLDPLTGIANRAHFDDTLSEMTAKIPCGGSSFSLIICDIDYFKRVNDVHGHPAGDEALISFSSILNRHSRDGDLVARYGGEEFLLLAANCDIATATHRAEAIRAALEQTPLPSLGGESVTASFGVTEHQLGDTPESLVSRADRGLLMAKDNGRNRVVQLGSGHQETQPGSGKRNWLGWLDSDGTTEESEFKIRTPVPVDIVIEKLRGFIADHNAEIINVTENQVSLKVNALCADQGRRRVDKRIALRAQFSLMETKTVDSGGVGMGSAFVSTNVHIKIVPIRNRDRRNRELAVCINQVVASVKSYLMGEVVEI